MDIGSQMYPAFKLLRAPPGAHAAARPTCSAVGKAPLASSRPACTHACKKVRECSESRDHRAAHHKFRNGFVSNAVDGKLLAELSEKDMQEELGLTTLQARKIKTRLFD